MSVNVTRAERTCRMETDELFPVGHAVCSACGKYVSVGNYCPNCGAKVKKLKKRNAKGE